MALFLQIQALIHKEAITLKIINHHVPLPKNQLFMTILMNFNFKATLSLCLPWFLFGFLQLENRNSDPRVRLEEWGEKQKLEKN